jgi:hypothetical protein
VAATDVTAAVPACKAAAGAVGGMLLWFAEPADTRRRRRRRWSSGHARKTRFGLTGPTCGRKSTRSISHLDGPGSHPRLAIRSAQIGGSGMELPGPGSSPGHKAFCARSLLREYFGLG